MKFILLLLLGSGLTAYAQPLLPFSGMVLQAGGRQPVAGATLWLQTSKLYIQADSLGRFHFPLVREGKEQVQIRAAGFKKLLRDIWIPADTLFLLQPETIELDQVVVTAVAGNTSWRKTPVAITTVPQKELARNIGMNVIDAVAAAVPGMSAITTGPNISKPFIRGLGYNRVLTLYDGLRQEGQQWGDEHGIEIDPNSIARAEVVKGPASLFYGSDAIAGVVNLIPVLPADTDGKLRGDLSSEYQSNNHMQGLSAGIRYLKNKLGFNLRASVRQATDYRNAFDGWVYNTGFTEKNLSGLFSWEKNRTRHFIGSTLYDNLQEIPDGSRDSATRAFTYQVAEADKEDIRNRPIVTDAMFRSRQIAPLHQHIQHYRIYHKMRLALGGGEFSTLAGLQQNIRREYNHPTAPQQPGLDVSLQTLNYEARYRFPAVAGITLSYGINGMWQWNRNRDATDFPIPDYRLFDMGHFIMASKEKGRSVFTGGLRWDMRKIHWDDFYTSKERITGFVKQVHLPDTMGATRQFPSYTKQLNGFSGSIGWVYAYNENITWKINIASGYRCPSIPEIGAGGLDPGAHIYYLGNRSFVPETNWQADIGMRINQKGWDAGAEFFYNQIQHYIYLRKLFTATGQPLEIVPGNFTYQYQQGSAAIYGAEYHINLHPAAIPWLTVQHNFSAIQGVNTDEAALQISGEEARYLPLLPPLRTQNSIRLQQPQPNGRLADLYLQAEADTWATQNRFYAVDQTESATPGYTLVHVSSGISWRNKKDRTVCQLVVSVRNLLDESYQAHQNRLKYFEYYSSSPNGRSGIYNMGRNCSVKLIVYW